MSRRHLAVIIGLVLAIFASGSLAGETRDDLCYNIDQKPVLSLQQIRQAELAHYLVVLSDIPESERPSPEGKTPEQFYQEEVKLLTDYGYPPMLMEIEPDRLVTRRYFASILYQLACDSDEAFKIQYGGLTTEGEQCEALVKAGWMYAEEGRIYREEILSILCAHQMTPAPPTGEILITPVEIRNVNLEVPLSPI